MSNSRNRLRTLVEGLCLATDSGKIDWSEQTSGIYTSQIANNKAEIANIGSDIRITIYDNQGNEVDSFDDNYFKDMTPSMLSYNTYYAAMAALYENARRNATGADKVIDEIISNLGINPVDDPPPF